MYAVLSDRAATAVLQVQKLHSWRWQGLRPSLLISLLDDCRALLADLPPERAAAVGETAALTAGVPAIVGMAEALRANLAMMRAPSPPSVELD